MQINRLKHSVEEITKWGEFYQQGHSLKETASQFNVSYEIIKQNLLRFGYRTPSKILSYQRVTPITYFDIIDSHEKAYFLGFMFADGYISKSPYGCSIGIALQLCDQYIIERLKECWNVNNKVGIYKNSCKISVTCQHMLETLKKLGIEFNKSHKDFSIPKIPSEFLNSFILGYFDGDGCITIKSTGYSVTSICCNSKQFLIEVKTLLEANTIICRPIATESKKVNNLYILYISKKENQLKFMDWVYKDSPIYLKRKYNKFLQIPR